MFKKPDKKKSSRNNRTEPKGPKEQTDDFKPDVTYLRHVFETSADVFFEETFYGSPPVKVTIAACEGLVDTEQLTRLVYERLRQLIERHQERGITKEQVLTGLHLPSVKEVTKKEQAVNDIYSGKALLLLGNIEAVFSINIANRPQRKPEDTAAEVTIKGPRDNFIEDLAINTALIRKRLRTNTLAVEHYEIGTRSSTQIGLLYVDDKVNTNILKGVKEKLTGINAEGIFSGNQLMELIDKPSPVFPRYDYTGRPDAAVQALLKGRIILLVDGVSYAIITPANLFLLIKTAEDDEYNPLFASFERILRILGIFVAALLPGFWVALTTFHQDQIPLILLATVVESRRGLPLPSSLEALIMVLMFEIFREAGMRLPPGIGSTLSVLGALIIGDAAINSGLTSPAMLVVISGSIVATFTLINQSLIGAISVLRLLSILLSSLFGLFGYFFSVFFILIMLSNMRTFGTPYLEITANLSWKNVKKSLLRLPFKEKVGQPIMFQESNPAKGDEENQ